MNINPISNVSFNGITKIYAITDSHQETRKAASFLSQILKDSKSDKNQLFLHCGDFIEGIYPKELERDCYIKMKEAKPDLEMVLTLGNHDFGHDKKGFDFLIDAVKKFNAKGIKVISANLVDSSGKRLEGVKPYTIIKRDGDKNFITGFCTNTISTQGQKFVSPIKQEESLNEIIKAIDREKPDNVIILNHDFLEESKQIVDYCKSKGINVDLLIGGHNHNPVKADIDRHIYYPATFAEGMYRFDLVNNKGIKELKNVQELKHDDLNLNQIFSSIEKYEDDANFMEPIAKSTLNLPKDYNNPCPLGSFLADSMKEASNADIAFFSTGFLKHSIPYKRGQNVTLYDYKRAMPTETPVKTVELNSSELKEVFSHAVKLRKYYDGNPKFVQCSNNVKLVCFDNEQKKCFELRQIYINDEPLLDNLGNPINKEKKYTCAIDSYLSDGNQQFKILGDKEKNIVYINNKESNICEVLKEAIQKAQNKYEPGTEYPCFKIETIE